VSITIKIWTLLDQKKEALLPAHSGKGICAQSSSWSCPGGNLSWAKLRQ